MHITEDGAELFTRKPVLRTVRDGVEPMFGTMFELGSNFGLLFDRDAVMGSNYFPSVPTLTQTSSAGPLILVRLVVGTSLS